MSFSNFFRPHQSLGGIGPADRFFGHEGAVAKAVAARTTENSLRLFLGEKARKTLFVGGQVRVEDGSVGRNISPVAGAWKGDRNTRKSGSSSPVFLDFV